MSPKFKLNLINQIANAIYKLCDNHDNIYIYIKQWHHWVCCDFESGRTDYNFDIEYYEKDHVNVLLTLNNIDSETLLKIAIDLGVETPDVIPSIPTFRNTIKAEYPTASATFEKAYKHIESEPETAIGLANSALESIIKEILKDNRITTQWSEKHSLHKLAVALLKEFKLAGDGDMPEEVKSIGTSLTTIAQKIENMRSNKSYFHGKTEDDYVISDPMYVYFVVNSVCSVGMFLRSFYKKHYPKQQTMEYNDVPEIDDLPF